MLSKMKWMLIVVSLATGCTTTTPEVLELSRVSAINAALITSELQRFTEDERRFAEARTQNMQRLHDKIARAREHYELDRLYELQVPGNKFQNREKEITGFIAEVDEVIKQARENRITVPAPKILTVDERVQALAALAKSMASLAKPSDLKADLKFLKGYIEAVRDHVKTATDAEPES